MASCEGVVTPRLTMRQVELVLVSLGLTTRELREFRELAELGVWTNG